MGNLIKNINIILCFIFIVVLVPSITLSAEVLQITSSSNIKIGDQNRNYQIKIACIDTEESKEEQITNWLRSELPRHSKVNLLPKGYEDGVLLARIVKLKSGNDISESMSNLGLAEFICD